MEVASLEKIQSQTAQGAGVATFSNISNPSLVCFEEQCDNMIVVIFSQVLKLAMTKTAHYSLIRCSNSRPQGALPRGCLLYQVGRAR
jgi:hypothetical protein